MPTTAAGQKDKIKKSRCKSGLQKRFLIFYRMIFGHISGIRAKKMVEVVLIVRKTSLNLKTVAS